MRYSKGICWLDDTRIPFVDEGDIQQGKTHFAGGNGMGVYAWNKHIKESGKEYLTTQGRFTPNLLVCDDMLNDGIKPNKGHRSKSKVTGYGEFGGGKSEYHGIGEYMEVDSKSRYYDLDMWFNKMIERL
jgi:hypothetical protein